MLNIFTSNDEKMLKKCLDSLKEGDVVVLTSESLLLLSVNSLKLESAGTVFVLESHLKAYGMTDNEKKFNIRVVTEADIVRYMVDIGSPLVWK